MDFASLSIDVMRERLHRSSDMLPSKIASLLIGLRNSSFITFLNVFFVSVGLSRFQAGLIVGLMQTLPIITGPIWCYISEVTKRRRLILLMLCLGGSFPLFSAPWVSKYIYPQSKYMCGNRAELNVTNSSTNNINQTLNDIFDCEERKQDAIQVLFQVLLIIGIISSMFLQSLQSYVNLIVVNIVKTNPRVSYGGQRVFTTIGVSLGSYFTGKAVNHFHRVDMSPYTAVFLFYLPYTLLLFPVGCYLISQLNAAECVSLEEEIIPCNQGQHCDDSKWYRLLNSDAVFYMSSTANLLIWHFSQVYVADVMKRSKSEMEFTFIISAIAEVCFFPFAACVIRVLRSPVSAIMLGLVLHMCGSSLMSHKMDFELLVVVQITGAMTFALSWCAIFERIGKTPTTLIRTIMTVLAGMMYVSAGSLIGNIVGGKVYGSYEGRKLFFMEAFVCLVWIAVAVVTLIKKFIEVCCLGRNKKRTESLPLNYGTIRQNTKRAILLRVAPDGYDEIY